MGLFAVSVEGEYSRKGKTNKLCILLKAKDEKDAVRQAQFLFLQKFPDDYVLEFSFIKITVDATKENPSVRSPVELDGNEYGNNSN
jgi:hypothetical protein